jgi:hypothetical protein
MRSVNERKPTSRVEAGDGLSQCGEAVDLHVECLIVGGDAGAANLHTPTVPELVERWS